MKRPKHCVWTKLFTRAPKFQSKVSSEWQQLHPNKKGSDNVDSNSNAEKNSRSEILNKNLCKNCSVPICNLYPDSKSLCPDLKSLPQFVIFLFRFEIS